jgi:hypothetical protein
MSLINWFKCKTSVWNLSENTKIFIDSCTNRSSAIPYRTIFTPTSTYIFRWRGNGCDIRHAKQTVFRTEDQLCFFIDYHKHPADMADIIKNAFGRESGILGRCL